MKIVFSKKTVWAKAENQEDVLVLLQMASSNDLKKMPYIARALWGEMKGGTHNEASEDKTYHPRKAKRYRLRQCKECGVKVHGLQGLATHKSWAHNGEDNQSVRECPHCGRKCVGDRGLNIHIGQSHGR